MSEGRRTASTSIAAATASLFVSCVNETTQKLSATVLIMALVGYLRAYYNTRGSRSGSNNNYINYNGSSFE